MFDLSSVTIPDTNRFISISQLECVVFELLTDLFAVDVGSCFTFGTSSRFSKALWLEW